MIAVDVTFPLERASYLYAIYVSTRKKVNM